MIQKESSGRDRNKKVTWLCFKTKFVLPDIIGFVLILGAIEVVSVITFKEKK